MSKHTPEPWGVHGIMPYDVKLKNPIGVGKVTGNGDLAYFAGPEDAHRAVACVNALAGIPNPTAHAEYVKAMREELEMWRAKYANRPCDEDPCPVCTACARTDAARFALAQTAQEDRT